MTSYYQHFENFSDIIELFIKLTRKYARFQWDDTCQTAFDSLKMKFTEVVILAYPDTNKDYMLYTDASDQSNGVCLSQLLFDQKKRKCWKVNLFLIP